MSGDQKNPKHHFKGKLIGVFIFVTFLIQLFLFIPKPANALFGVGDVTFTTVIQDIPAKLWQAITSAVEKSSDIAFKNALRTFTQQLAYDTAVKIASGAAGQKPLFNTTQFGQALLDAGNSAVGDYLDQITSEAWGKSICDINPTLKVSITESINLDLGLPTPGSDRKAKCDVTSIVSKFTDGTLFSADIDLGFAIKGVDPAQLSRTILQEFPNMFGEDTAQVGQYLKIYREAKTEKQKAEEAEAAKQAKDFTALTSIVTGDIKTPAATIEAAQNFALWETTTADKTSTGSIIADMIGTFTNTLVKKYMEYILVKGLNPAADNTGFDQGKFGRSSGIAAAEAKFASFNQPSLSAGGSVDILNKLSSCPTDFAEPENCAIDSSFRTAVEQQLRLEEAIELGYINGDKPFGYGDGGSQLNYQEGYPYRSLVLLRRYRIVPVSWELAASYIREFGGGARSLNDLIKDFNDETSQYYQLIDPDWVLKAPATQCVNSGYNETFLFDEYIDDDGIDETPKVRQIQRNTSCVDDQSCIAEDETGNCLEYGYCTKEDPIWRFNGESCPDYYNTCTTYTDRQGQPASYLATTLDFNGCSADNVGCQWYCKEYNQTDERWECYWDDLNNDDYSAWSDGVVGPSGYVPPAAGASWLSHLTASAETCDASAAGCDEFIRTTNGTNLHTNPSFDYYDNLSVPDDGIADNFDSAWAPVFGAEVEIVTPNTPGDSPYAGNNALILNSGPALTELLVGSAETGSPVSSRTFTVSIYAKKDPNDLASCNNNSRLEIVDAINVPLESVNIDNISSEWQRYVVTYTYPDSFPIGTEHVAFEIAPDSGCNLLLDATMVEESKIAREYVDYGAINKVYLNGERDTCDPLDVGCQFYTPLLSGDPVPAQIRPSDECSAEDVGCKAFEEVKLTTVMPDPNNIERSGQYCYGGPNEGEACLINADCGTGACLPVISFIPDTGEQCSAAYVGCEEYTNLDEVAAGGEGIEYYSFLKQCVPTNSANIDTYYAWEGDAVAGYQLRSFRLKQSNIVYTGGPVEVGNAPCTHLNVDPNPTNLTCADTNANIQADSECSAVYGTDPDCTQFFDASLHVFYRYKSMTISVTDDCHPERNSIDGDTYYGTPSESRSCPAQYAGCREYLGNSGYNYRQIFSDDFEDGTTMSWAPGTVSNNSIIVGGHSLNTNANTEKPVTLEDGKTYELKFWGRSDSASDNMYIKFNTAIGAVGGDNWFADQSGTTFPPEVWLTPEWQEFRLGPVTINTSDTALWSGLPTALQFQNVGSQIYLDNIELVETTTNRYLVRGSYDTCYGSENCEAYSDVDSNIHYLMSFSKLCSEDTVGCEALIDTANTRSPYAEEFGDPAQTLSHVITPDDSLVTVINNPDNYCSADNQGCSRLGLPNFDEENNLISYEDVYLKDNAAEYDNIWCDNSESGCEEYGFSGGGGKTYFKQPIDGRTCEYKQLQGSYDFDWYISGTETPCETTPTPPSPAIPAFVCEGGTPAAAPNTICNPDDAVPCADSARCVPWVGLCDSKADGCTAYSDPLDPIGCQPLCPYEGDTVLFDENCVVTPGGLPGCSTYYNIKSSVDSTSCNGVVNAEKGCVLFSDTTQSLNYTADLSPDGQEFYCDLGNPVTYGNDCDVDADCGAGGLCIENPEFGPPVLGRFGTCIGGTNPNDLCTSGGAECLGGGACSLYTAGGSPIADSNTVLKVKRDRVCDEWLYCKTSFEVDDNTDLDGDGKTKEDVCFEIGLCDELGSNGSCISTIDPGPTNVTGDTAAYPLDEFQNLSGYVSAGLQYGCRDDHSVDCTVATEATTCAGLGDKCDIIEGYYPYSEMYEVGLGGAITKDLVRFGDFESNALSRFMVCDENMDNKDTSCVVDENCVPDENLTAIPNCITAEEEGSWTAIFPDLDSSVSVVEGPETVGNSALDENNYLLYSAGSQGVCDDLSTNQGTICTVAGGECVIGSCEFTGLGIKTSLGTNILNNTEYIASLDFRFENLPEAGQETISVSLAQFENGNIVGENFLGYFDGSTGWEQQVLKPVRINGIPDENAETFLLIRNMGGNVSFSVDNVSMKPALAVKASDSPGIRGDFYTFVYQPSSTSVSGLNEECFTDGNLTTACPGNPYIVPKINWYEPCIACNAGDTALCTLCGNGDATVTIPGEMDPLVPDNADFIVANSSGRWEGGINIPTSGYQTLFFNVNDGVRIWVDDMAAGSEIVSAWGSIPTLGYMWSQYFTAGWHPVKIEFTNGGGYGGVQMGRTSGQWNPTNCGGGIPDAFCINYAWDQNGDGVISPLTEGMLFPTYNRITAIPSNYLIPQVELTTELELVFGNYLGTYVSDYLNYDNASMPTLLNDNAGATEMVAVRWAGKLLVENTGNHLFNLVVDDGYKFFIDDLTVPVQENWTDGVHNDSFTVNGLDAGWHPIMIEYYQKLGNSSMQFNWQPPGAPAITAVPAENLSTTDGDQKYLIRSCRAYPREDSEVCQYTNSDLVQFNGWQGYCIETDPTNPDKCITWWPVDVISGESSVFGTVDPAGYKGRRPLYMCVEATGNYDDTTLLVGNDDENSLCGASNIVTDLVGKVAGYRRNLVTNFTHAGDIEETCDGDDSGCGSLEDLGWCENYDGQRPLSDNAWGFCSCRGGGGINTTVLAQGSDRTYHDWEIDRIEWVQQRSSHSDWPGGGATWIANAENDWDISWDGNDNHLRIKTNFSATDHTIDNYYVYMEDGSGGSGGMWVMGYVYLRDVCTEVAKVASISDDKAWAQRTANTSSYQIRDILYKYNENAAPFGAIVAGQGDDPGSTWDSSVSDGMQPLYIENFDSTPTPPVNNTRAGSPYSCDGDCVPKVCMGGSYDTVHRGTQYACTTDADCGGEDGNRGVCVGLGYCSGDVTKYCTDDAYCTSVNAGSCVGAAARNAGDGVNQATGFDGNVWAVDNLQRIFAYVYDAWFWDVDTATYEKINPANPSWNYVWNNEFNHMPLCNTDGAGPRPTWPPDNDYCAILPAIDNVLINGADGDVELFGGGSITLSFTSFVDPEQEALKNIVIDWGDGSTSSIVWNGAPKSDPSQPHLFSHTYDEPGATQIYNIEIMLKDNWGFCNDQNSATPGLRPCDINSTTQNYQEFNGTITVQPS
ncbi:MAG: PA14 domain-containing protein [Patescibacteria group bacterium]|jgi:hypothetical protein